MNAEPVTIASDPADADAAAAVVKHHSAMVEKAKDLASSISASVSAPADLPEARSALVAYFRDEVIPHALAEESTMYRAAAEIDAARMLIDAMTGEHRIIDGLIDRLDEARAPGQVAQAAGALSELFVAHVAKENDLVLPLLAAAPGVSLAGLVGGLHELVGDAHAEHGEPGAGGCGCGCACGNG